jgi:hypothetical protein
VARERKHRAGTYRPGRGQGAFDEKSRHGGGWISIERQREKFGVTRGPGTLADVHKEAEELMQPFEQYLKQHHLEAITVSIQAHVRYTTVWNAMKGMPITSDHARKIRQGVQNLTGVPYTGSLEVILEHPLNALSTFPIRKISGHQ